jgi:hypothetical protein
MEVRDSDRDPTRSPDYPHSRDLTFPAEKHLFEKYARGRKVLVEIGVFEGASAVVFRRSMPGDATLHLIDPFVPDSMNQNLLARKEFTVRNVESVSRGRVVWHEDFSWNVAKVWTRPIDLLFIDGDHREQSCLRDWDDWSRFVKVGGVVLFHDARKGKGDGTSWEGWEGPTRVVDALFRGNDAVPGWEMIEELGTVVVVRKKDRANPLNTW